LEEAEKEATGLNNKDRLKPPEVKKQCRSSLSLNKTSKLTEGHSDRDVWAAGNITNM